MRVMKKNGKYNRIGSAAALVVCLFITVFSLVNLDIPVKSVGRGLRGELQPKELAAELSSGVLADSFRGKTFFVELNGLFARCTGRTELNSVMRLENGMLGPALDTIQQTMDVGQNASRIAELSDALAVQNIPFLYVQAPCKLDLQGAVLPQGISEQINPDIDRMLEQLEKRSVSTLDLRPQLAGNSELASRYFYRTDHHWTPEAALLGFGRILTWMKSNGYPDLDSGYARPELWEKHELPDWFLGSYGRRVGTLFAGVDDVMWYTPRFETDMICMIQGTDNVFRGDFARANIRPFFIERKDYYHLNPYCVYIGGVSSLVQHRNPSAPNREKILLIKDSFGLPMEAFLSCAFSRVDVIDLRTYTDATIAEYIRWSRPDQVIMLYNPLALNTPEYFDYGLPDVIAGEKETGTALLSGYGTELVSEPGEECFETLPAALSPGKRYRISLDALELLGEAEGVSLTVSDPQTGEPVTECAFTTDRNGNLTDDWEVIRCPEKLPATGEYSLRLYAGVRGDTAPGGIRCRGLTVEELPES